MATKKVDDMALSSPRKELEYHTVDFSALQSPIKPSAPPAESPVEAQAIKVEEISPELPPLAPPEYLPPSTRAKRGLAWLTLKLVPYHALSFALGIAGFCVVVPGVVVASCLLPLCCLGVPIYFLLLHITRIMVAMDISLANTITQPHATACWTAPDELDGNAAIGYELRIAPGLTRISIRSTLMVLYFATIKFVCGVISCCVVVMPFAPLASEIADLAGATDSNVAGWNASKFNFRTHPVWYTIAFVAYVVGGIALMHFFGIVSRETTRFCCCVEVEPLSTEEV